MKKSFKFLKPGKLVDADLELVASRTIPADPVKKYVPCYEFELRETGKPAKIGCIRLPGQDARTGQDAVRRVILLRMRIVPARLSGRNTTPRDRGAFQAMNADHSRPPRRSTNCLQSTQCPLIFPGAMRQECTGEQYQQLLSITCWAAKGIYET
jgi:hypothetical protein